MSTGVCPQCGASIDPGASECKYCGEKFATQFAGAELRQTSQPQPQQTIVIQQQPQQVVYTNIDPTWPIKSKVVAGILAIFLGGLGIHKFYLGKIGTGILYLIFCWTGIPEIVGFIEGIVYLCSNDENFSLKHHVRVQ